MTAILFVCTANICRSPMAAELFKNMVAQEEENINWKVDSGGTWTVDGLPAAEMAMRALQQRGLDLSNHKSRVVTNIDLDNYDLILTMERGHKESLVIEFPQVKDRIYLLSEMVNSLFDIHDPIGGTMEDFEDTIELLENILSRGYPKIKKLSLRDL